MSRARHMTRWIGWAAVLGAAIIALSGGRTWVRFTVQDPVLGEGLRTANGYDASSALSAAAVLGLAAMLTALLTRQRLRMLALSVLCLDAFWAIWLAVQVATDPARAAGQGASEDLQATTTGAVTVTEAATTPWVWVFVIGAILVALGAAWLASRAVRSAPDVADATTGQARRLDHGQDQQLPDTEVQRRTNTAAWNDLSRGDDPTDDA